MANVQPKAGVGCGEFTNRTNRERCGVRCLPHPTALLVDHLEDDIWEVRIKLDNRIARVLFVIDKHTMILLHGFIKKSQKAPKPEIDLAKQRLKVLRGKQ